MTEPAQWRLVLDGWFTLVLAVALVALAAPSAEAAGTACCQCSRTECLAAQASISSLKRAFRGVVAELASLQLERASSATSAFPWANRNASDSPAASSIAEKLMSSIRDKTAAIRGPQASVSQTQQLHLQDDNIVLSEVEVLFAPLQAAMLSFCSPDTPIAREPNSLSQEKVHTTMEAPHDSLPHPAVIPSQAPSSNAGYRGVAELAGHFQALGKHARRSSPLGLTAFPESALLSPDPLFPGEPIVGLPTQSRHAETTSQRQHMHSRTVSRQRRALSNLTSYDCSLASVVAVASGFSQDQVAQEAIDTLFPSSCIEFDPVDVRMSSPVLPKKTLSLRIDTDGLLSDSVVSVLDTALASPPFFDAVVLVIDVPDWEAILGQILSAPRWPHSVFFVSLRSSSTVDALPGELQASAFSRFPNTTILDIRHKGLQRLPIGIFNPLPTLLYLTISGTQLTTLAEGIFDPIPTLMFLVIGNSPITSLPRDVFAGLSSLLLLTIRDTLITSVPSGMFQSQSEVRVLHLRHNMLTTLPLGVFDAMHELTFLFLDNNELEHLPTGIFANQLSLIRIFLYDNKLRTLPTGIFDSQKHLFALDLRDNDLRTLPETILHNRRNMTFLRLSGNPSLRLPAASLMTLGPLSILDLDRVRLSGDVHSVFAAAAGLWNLTTLSIGWEGLHEGILPVSAVCALLAPRADVLSISHSSYSSIDACLGHRSISELVLTFNGELEAVSAATHNILNVSYSPALVSLTTTGSISTVDVSSTQLPFSPQFCGELGSTLFFARGMGNLDALEPERLLRQCFLQGLAFDFSNNPNYFADLAVLSRGIPQDVVLGEPDATVIDVFADTGRRAQFRSTVPVFLFDGNEIQCEVDFSVHSLQGLQENLFALTGSSTIPVPTFSTICACAGGHERVGDRCTPIVPRQPNVAGIVVASAIGFSLFTVAVQFAFRWVRRKQRERYLLLEENEMQERLLTEATEEVAALKEGWRISLDDIHLIRKVDEGAFGAVWRGDWEGVAVAVKFLKLASAGIIDPFALSDIGKEVDFLQRTRHTNLVRFFGTGNDAHGAPFLVLEFVDLGSLKHLLHEKGLDNALRAAQPARGETPAVSSFLSHRLRNVQALKFSLASDIADGMAFLHSLNVMHRDLKSGNVLVTKRLVAKITDFGSMSGKLSGIQQSSVAAKEDDGPLSETTLTQPRHAESTLGLTMTAGVGTPLYMAPEILDPKNRKLSLKADVFSFGVVMWEICECRVPDLIVQEIGDTGFNGFVMQTLFRLYREGKHLLFQQSDRGENAPSVPSCPTWYCELSQSCMAFLPADRPPFSEIQEAFHHHHDSSPAQ